MFVDGVKDDESGVTGDLELCLTDGGAVVDKHHHMLRLRPHRGYIHRPGEKKLHMDKFKTFIQTKLNMRTNRKEGPLVAQGFEEIKPRMREGEQQRLKRMMIWTEVRLMFSQLYLQLFLCMMFLRFNSDLQKSWA